tara:strand:+ start:460 stop:723 length:264 start_codon:yes stop_codon:yes gene_type:complete
MKKSSAFKMKGPGQKSPVKANKKLIKQAGEIGKKGRNKLKEMIFDIPASRLLKKAKKAKQDFKDNKKLDRMLGKKFDFSSKEIKKKK